LKSEVRIRISRDGRLVAPFLRREREEGMRQSQKDRTEDDGGAELGRSDSQIVSRRVRLSDKYQVE
jgi:hypothetical protein